MIAERQTDVTVEGSLDGEKVAMGIDQGALAHIMNVLTDLYSDRELAVIREYSTNALDAHIEIGNTDPIQIELPTPLAPFLRIRDFGVGLSIEDIRSIYSQYGASTKRSTNDQVGMLGLGCKSALTYTDQFTLVSVKDGTRTQVAISRDDDGSGSMTVVDQSPTDDPSGTEIVVPVKRTNDIEHKARRFFSYWKPGTVLINGAPPEPIKGLRVTDRLVVVPGGYEDRIVMGNVAYPVDFPDLNLVGHSLVAYVDIGAVNFPPSRESLMDTAKTRTTIEAIVKDFDAHRASAIQRQVDAAPTVFEAARVAGDYHNILNHYNKFDYTYKGAKIPNEIGATPKDADDTRPCCAVPFRSGTLSRHSVYGSLPLQTVNKSIWAYGWDRASFTAGQKKKILKWCAEKDDITPEYIILSYNKPNHSEWIDPANLVEWKDINAVKLERAAVTRSGRIPGSYDLYEPNSLSLRHGIPGDDIDTSKPIYYVPSRVSWYTQQGILPLLTEKHPKGFTLVVLQSPRISKFCRLFPKAKEAESVVQAAVDAFVAGLTDTQKKAYALRSSHFTRQLQQMDAGKIDDPDLKAAISEANIDLTTVVKRCKLLTKAAGMDPLYDLGRNSKSVPNPLKHYPLYDEYSFAKHKQHTYDYINAAYAARTKED